MDPLFGGLGGLGFGMGGQDGQPRDRQLVMDLFAGMHTFEPPSGPTASEVALDGLAKIDEKRLKSLGKQDESCPVCMQSFLAVLAEEEMAEAMESPTHSQNELGVNQLDKPHQCGHIFCRRDIVKWISEGKDTCPICRKNLLPPDFQPAKPRVVVYGATDRVIQYFEGQGFEVVVRSRSKPTSFSRGASGGSGIYS
ncbi:hypothetical protein FA13DRAFT_1814876 [Coprinellus micaceus]|uniref:RING-type domain-containing protein n=1 Tax=Coprinellus micaceus TaxID=71717 RepID=A0A4Y7T9K2_COPMI|nr:hypothetical protein FA13DRAFT_1814876 [Coprinellus micaceus]